MHRLIREILEEYLEGGLCKRPPGELEAHLARCDGCREELDRFREQAELLKALRAPAEAAPAPGFYARVLERIEAGHRAPIWSAFLDPVFGRRLAIGSLAALVMLGSFLLMTERDNVPLEATAASIIAVADHPPGLGQNPQRDRDTILVTLATFHE